MQKGKRSDAKVALNDVALSMQRCFTTQSTYKPATSGTCPVVDKVQTTEGVKSAQGFYVIKVDAADLDTSKYTLKATAVTGKGQDKDKTCATFVLDNTGKRSSLDKDNNDSTSKCWP
jgi:Tfp pilus assembly protein PilE